MATRRHLLASSAAVAATAWVAPSVITLDRVAAAAVSGTAEIPQLGPGAAWFDPAPPNLAVGAVESDTETPVFLEVSCFELDAPIVVNRSTAGAFNGNSNQNTVIPAGTRIASYFAHGDKLTIPGRLTGSMTFTSQTILGLIYETAQFNATSFLEIPGTNYVYGGAEGGDNMTLALTPGANTVTWDLNFGPVTDQIRVITTCS